MYLLGRGVDDIFGENYKHPPVESNSKTDTHNSAATVCACYPRVYIPSVHQGFFDVHQLGLEIVHLVAPQSPQALSRVLWPTVQHQVVR